MLTIAVENVAPGGYDDTDAFPADPDAFIQSLIAVGDIVESASVDHPDIATLSYVLDPVGTEQLHPNEVGPARQSTAPTALYALHPDSGTPIRPGAAATIGDQAPPAGTAAMMARIPGGAPATGLGIPLPKGLVLFVAMSRAGRGTVLIAAAGEGNTPEIDIGGLHTEILMDYLYAAFRAY